MRPPVFRLLVLALGAAVLAGCRSRDPEVFVSNVSAEEIISLNKARDQGAISALRLHIEGELAGTAQLTVLTDGQPQHVATLAGSIDVEWTRPWSEARVRLHYVPEGHASGSVRIRYRFVDS